MSLFVKAACNKDLTTHGGHTPLHLSVNRGFKKCVEALVNSGADVNAQDEDGDTCLHFAMMKATVRSVLSAAQFHSKVRV